MLRGTVVFIIAFMSITFLKRVLYRHHWTSLSLLFIGLALVGATPLIFPDKEEKEGDDKSPLLVILGIALIIIAQMFTGSYMVIEEKLFSKYSLHPLKVVGWEGVWGTILYAILLVILQFIPCQNKDLCPHGTVEDTIEAVREWGRNSGIWITQIIFVISVALFN